MKAAVMEKVGFGLSLQNTFIRESRQKMGAQSNQNFSLSINKPFRLFCVGHSEGSRVTRTGFIAGNRDVLNDT